MQKIKYFITNPAGNITAFIKSKTNKEDRINISKKIMCLDKRIEQVAFIEYDENNYPISMTMSGNEFCGNASRSFALYLAKYYKKEEKGYIDISVSGSKEILKAYYDISTSYASIIMPEVLEIKEITFKDFKYPTFNFGGICHAIIEMEEDINFVNDFLIEFQKNVLSDAYGVIFFNKNKNSIVPYVYVKNTQTLIREGSCGSGTVAIGNYINMCEKVEFKCTISQPSGDIKLICQFNNTVPRYYIGSKIIFEDEKEFIC